MDRFFDVFVNPAALPHGGDDGGEVVVGQDHVGSRLRDLRAGNPHRAPDVGGAQGRGVVHAVARHGHDLAPRLERAHDAHLVLRRNARKHPVPVDVALQLRVGETAQLRAGQHVAAALRDAELRRDGGGRGGVVARDHDGPDARPFAQGDGAARLRARRVRHADQAAEGHAGLKLFTVPGNRAEVAVSHAEHAQRRRGHGLVLARRPAGSAPREQKIRRALGDGPVPAAGQPVHRRHPLARAGKRELQHARVPAAVRPQRAGGNGAHDGGLRGVARDLPAGNLTVRAERGHAQQPAPFGGIRREDAPRRAQFDHRHAVLGQGPRLVRTDDARAAEGLDRRQAAHDGAFGRHAPHPGRQRDGHHGGQALRDGGDRKADRNQEHLQRVDPLEQTHDENHEADGQRPDAEGAPHAGQPLLERRLRRGLAADHAGDAPHLRAHSGLHHQAAPVPGGDGAA